MSEYKGCPYENAVVEATFEELNTELLKQETFNNLKDLKLELDDYIN
ncbi:IS3 family transposase [Paenibacillus sp. UMB4589-SE434]